MIERELWIPIVLGAAFAVLYWAGNVAVIAVSGVGEAIFQVFGVVMVVVWSVLAAYLLAPDPRRTTDFREEMMVLGLYWLALFGGTALVISVVFGAVGSVIWPAGVTRTTLFGMLLGATVVLGVLAMVLGGVARREGLAPGA